MTDQDISAVALIFCKSVQLCETMSTTGQSTPVASSSSSSTKKWVLIAGATAVASAAAAAGVYLYMRSLNSEATATKDGAVKTKVGRGWSERI